jgi:Nuclease-related domain
MTAWPSCTTGAPPSKANIDHLVIAPRGVFVVDAKNYKGQLERRDRGGFFSTDYRLYVGGRDKTALVAGMAKQAEAVRAALDDEDASLQICKIICFVDARRLDGDKHSRDFVVL